MKVPESQPVSITFTLSQIDHEINMEPESLAVVIEDLLFETFNNNSVTRIVNFRIHIGGLVKEDQT